MEKDSLLKPLQVRFTEPADVEMYGGDWYTYDELAIVTKPARELVRLEAEMGVTLVDAMKGVREDSALGDTCAAWLAIRQSGRAVDFETFNPAIKLASWRVAPEVPEVPKEPASEGVSLPTPEDPAFASLEHSETGRGLTTSGDGTALADIVVLPIMPAVESPSS